MAFGYAVIDLDAEQKHARRALLEFYPVVAELSVLAVFAAFQLVFFLSWAAGRLLDSERPKSPLFDKRSTGNWSWLRRARQGFAELTWWMGKPVVESWGGTRGECIFGGTWTVWLLYLSMVQTGNDYMHLTKRFGIIGASQLPLQYLLAMRSPYSPVQFLTRLSHEELKASHQVLGRIVYFLFTLHVVFYLGFFVVSGYLAKRIKDDDVIWGIISFALFSAISTAALGVIRRWNYRVFFVSHMFIAQMIVMPLYLHVSHIRPYVYQVIAINVAHMLLRIRGLKEYSGTVKLIAGTDLVQVQIPLTAKDAALKWKPGQHVYLNRPSGNSQKTSTYSLLRAQSRGHSNPFTVASIPAKDRELTLVARTLNGNTKHLAALARSLSSAGSDTVLNINVALEGPYGASTRLPDWSAFDGILFVAGGVGATFIVPLYRSLVESTESSPAGRPRIRFIWAVRKLAEIQWAFPASSAGEVEAEPSSHSSAVEVHVTRPLGPDLRTDDSGEDMEMAEHDQLLSVEEQMEKPRKGVMLRTHRPKVSAIVDAVFSQGNRVAVIACGPKALSAEVSDAVEQWVRKGHEVYFHNETFGW